MASPGRTSPSTTRTSATTPRYWSNLESKIRARNGASGLPRGAGISAMICSSRSSTPAPVLALIRNTLSAGIPVTCSISKATSSGREAGRSTLLIAPITVRFCSRASRKFDRVCASMPCDASTTSTAPSQAARLRDTS